MTQALRRASLLLVVVTSISGAAIFSHAYRANANIGPNLISAVMQNSSQSGMTVDIYASGGSLDHFASSGTATANATDRANITYGGAHPTAAVINDSSHVTFTFAVSASFPTAKSGGSLTVADGTILDSSADGSVGMLVVDGSITDSAAPIVLSMTPSSASPSTSTDNNVGPYSITFTISYSEATDAGAGPSISFSPDAVTAGDLTPETGSWSTTNFTNDTWQQSFDLADLNYSESLDVTIGAQADLNSNDSSPYLQTGAYTIDTLNPYMLEADTKDADRNGHVDGIEVDFNEALRDSTVAASDFVINDCDTGSATRTVTDAVQSDPGVIELTLTPDATIDTGVTCYVSLVTHSLTDNYTHGNYDTADVSTPFETTDEAPPVLLSVAPANGGHSTPTQTVVATFSEPMDESTLDTAENGSTYSLDENGDGASGVNVSFADDDTQMIVSHTIFSVGSDIQFNLAPAAGIQGADGNMLCGSLGALSHCADENVTDYTVRASSGGGGGGSSTATPSTSATITLNVPKNGDSLSGGSTEAISWTSGGTGINNVRLYQSLDGGATWSTLATGLTPTGTYNWTVPNTATNQAEIKAVGYDSGAAELSSASSGDFQITFTSSLPPSSTPSPTSTDLLSRTDANAKLPSSAPVDSLVKSTSSSSVYYIGLDAKRHPFPNEGVYMSWYQNFDNVVTLSDAEIASIQMGTPVLYRPGTVLVKIVSDARVYAVSPGYVLHWVGSEDIAKALYGTNWSNRVVDVDPVYFEHYTAGSDITTATYPDGSLVETTTNDTIYYIVGGTKRPFASSDAFAANFFQDRSVIANDNGNWTTDTLGSSISMMEDGLYSDQLVTP